MLSVVEGPGSVAGIESAVYDEETEQMATEAVNAVPLAAKDRGVEWTITRVKRGRPAEEIVEYLGANEIHAVGMGTTGRRGTERILLSSVAEKTVRSAPVPVLTVPGSEDIP